MSNRCRECGVPFGGVIAKLLSLLMSGIRPSKKYPGLCNICAKKELAKKQTKPSFKTDDDIKGYAKPLDSTPIDFDDAE